MYIVDTHLHNFTAREKADDWDPRTLLEGGVINKAWLLSLGGVLEGTATDDEVIALARQYPDLFVPFGYLDFRRGVERIDWLYEQGCIGLKAIWPAKPYDSKEYFPYYERAETLHMPILFHVGGGYYFPTRGRKRSESFLNMELEHSFGRNMLPIHMDAIAKSFPDLVIIMAHMGGNVHYFEQAAWICYGNSGMWGRARMYMDISSDLTYMLPALVMIGNIMREIGPDCFLYGSDTSYSRAIEVARFWKFFFKNSPCMKDDDIAKIMGLNAEECINEALRHRSDAVR
ncbi:MAG: amidohydrolase family protein [Planctomycetota bacterium]|nr:amidohydrolase family protein [Planctomycetota bacterium]